MNCCGQSDYGKAVSVIAYFLEKEHRIILSTPTIYAILNQKFVLRQKGRKKTARGPIPEAVASREVVLFTPA